MYLTRLSLDPRSMQARRDLASPYEMHRTLVRVFVPDAVQPTPRFLWRLEAQGLGDDAQVLVQSGHDANWSVMDGLAGYLRKPVETKLVSLDSLLRRGGRYRFRLVANPTVSREGKRYGLASEVGQLEWLARQGERFGFRIDGAMITASDVLKARKGQALISLQRVCYEGILQVQDVEDLANAIRDGVGHGKAFGCGLLSMART